MDGDLACPVREQAEVGQSPTLLAFCAAKRVLSILRGYLPAPTAVKWAFSGYFRVFHITGYLYNYVSGYKVIYQQSFNK
ncbi:hypothetical protein DIU36_01945 [Mucilaginibacter rubeus]|nr:hypothetical protein DIU36_01945 [Mucilaginibacter rubeus]